MFKNILVAFGIVAGVSGGFAWLYGNFTPLSTHRALAGQVSAIKLQQLKDYWQIEVFKLRDMAKRHPNDQLAKRMLEKAEIELTITIKRLEKLQ